MTGGSVLFPKLFVEGEQFGDQLGPSTTVTNCNNLL